MPATAKDGGRVMHYRMLRPVLGALTIPLVLLFAAFAHDARTNARCLSVVLAPAHVQKVVDGDTYDLHHVGTPPRERIRVLGVDAPEPRDPLGSAATDSTKAWLARAPFQLHACQRDSFGRLLAWTTRGTDSLHVYLITHGLGTRAP